ncbi:MAG: Calx-beta domain-containing protein, partial [Dolichospermum sp.]
MYNSVLTADEVLTRYNTLSKGTSELPNITLAVSPSSVTEDGTTNLVYTFTRTGATTSALTVNYGITGTANSTDYTGATPGTGKTITFAAGASTATLTIDPTADTIVESDETVALTLATGTGYNIGTTTAVTGTITNDDLLPKINLSANQTIVEGNTNPQNVTYTVTLSNASTQTITVQYATANGTAIAGSDYTSTSGTLTFDPGV